MRKSCIFILYLYICLQCCNGQVKDNYTKNDYIKKVEKEVSSDSFTDNLFSDTVIFEIINKKTIGVNKIEIETQWNKVKQIFRKTDFVVNNYKNDCNANCLEVKNHKKIYYIKFNEIGKIISVKEKKIELPPNAPPN